MQIDGDWFFKHSYRLYRESSIESVDTTHLEFLHVKVLLKNGTVLEVWGMDAIDLVMLVKPSALEGRRLFGIRMGWAIHNLIGHPVLQLLAFVGLHRWGMWVHDATVPKPREK